MGTSSFADRLVGVFYPRRPASGYVKPRPDCYPELYPAAPPPESYRMPRSILLLSCLLSASLTALAFVDPPAVAGPTAFKGATIHTAAGPKIESGVLVIDKGVI